MAGKRADQKQASRTALIEAAIRLIARGGIAEVSHRSVAAEVGVSPALVTYHFASLEGLLNATRQEAIRIGAQRLAIGVEAVRNGQKGLIEVTAAYLSGVILNRVDEFVVSLEFDLATARNGAPPTENAHARDGYIALIRPFVASEEIARRIFSAVFGYAFHARLGLHSGAPEDCAAFLTDLFDRYDLTIPHAPHDKDQT